MTFLLLTLGLLAAVVIFGLFRKPHWSDFYRIEEAVVTFSNPPRTYFYVWGRWPKNLVLFYSCGTREAAEAWAFSAMEIAHVR